MKSSDKEEMNIKTGQLWRNKWLIVPPKEEPNEEGNTVLIRELSFGPLETLEYGFNKDGKPYHSYQWLENDFYADESFIKEITISELLEKLKKNIDFISNTEFSNWKATYEKIVRKFYENVEFP